MQRNAGNRPPRPASSLGRLTTVRRGQSPVDKSIHGPEVEPGPVVQGSSSSPHKLRRVSSFDSSATASKPGSSAAESQSMVSCPSCTEIRCCPRTTSGAKPESTPPRSPTSTESSRASSADSGIKSRTILEPVSLFPISETFLPRAKPLSSRKLQKRTPSVLVEASAAPRPSSAGASSLKGECPKPVISTPTHPSHARRIHSSTSIRPHTVCDASEISLQMPNNEQNLDSQELPSPVSSTRHDSGITATCGSSSSHSDKSDGTWVPPDSWLGPTTHDCEKSKECPKNNHRTRTRKLFSRFIRVSPSSWNLSFLTHVTECDMLDRHPVKEELPEEQEVIVMVEGKDGMSTQAVYEVIPRLRALKSSRR
ncbi:hypothetical protein F5141DRAFT_1216761 [Pisolithus sp. B1]|nr:hypothetical protein F5141DRAFT_1216761 [Pisolithus sp. B1]